MVAGGGGGEEDVVVAAFRSLDLGNLVAERIGFWLAWVSISVRMKSNVERNKT